MKCSFLIVLFLAMPAGAQECSSVIALSKIISTSVADKNAFEQQAQNFCSEYSTSTSSGKSMSAGGSYGAISGSFGSSKVSAAATAGKVCSGSNSASASADAYKNYIETISPKAYGAYEQCLRMSQDMRFRVDTGSVLPKQFSMTATFVSTVVGVTSAVVSYSASDGVTCYWNGSEVRLLEIKTGETALLDCRRADSQLPSFVKLVRTTGSNEMTLPWGAYNAEGVLVDSLFELQRKVSELSSRVDQVSFLSGTFPIRQIATRPLDDSTSCLEGADGLRGEMSGRVTFDRPFASVPVVSLGLSHIDIVGGQLGDTNRLRVGVTSIDETGFSYQFYTWCRTKVHGATASWIAIAK